VDAGTLLAIVTGILGLAGLIWSGLHFNADSSKAIVEQQSAVLKDMGVLNDEQRKTVADLRAENDRLKGELARRQLPPGQ